MISSIHPLLVFAIVGGIGFIVDAGLLTLLYSLGGINLYLSRLFSFTAASFVTWLLNRTNVFYVSQELSGKDKSHEYMAYVSVQIIGALINLSVFVAVISLFPMLSEKPVIPLATGAVVAMIFNYTALRFTVYRSSLTAKKGIVQ